MKKTRFTEEQMVTIPREADAKPVPEVAKKHGVAAATIYAWRKHFGSLEPSDVKTIGRIRASQDCQYIGHRRCPPVYCGA
jgi:putative transposase